MLVKGSGHSRCMRREIRRDPPCERRNTNRLMPMSNESVAPSLPLREGSASTFVGPDHAARDLYARCGPQPSELQFIASRRGVQ